MRKRRERSPKPWKLDPSIRVYRPNLEGFFRFVCERQKIWHRRFVLRQSPPWTRDRLLRDYKFTNVYRELDRGTIWLVNNIIEPNDIFEDRENLFWQIIIYRILNKVETFEAAFLPDYETYASRSNRSELRRALYKIKKSGKAVFTSAHLTLPTHEIGKKKIETYMEVLADLHKKVEGIADDCESADTLEEVFKILKKRVKCVGDFIAYEICIDLMYAHAIRFKEDDWVIAGPGCRVGIGLIFPKWAAEGRHVEAIKKLRWSQRKAFRKLHLRFPFLDGKDLTLRNIEHSLCEFGKYWKLKNSCGKNRQLFRPKNTEDLPTGQIALRGL